MHNVTNHNDILSCMLWGGFPWALDFSLKCWLLSLCECWLIINFWSSIGNWAIVYWSRCTHISRADRPLLLIPEFKWAVSLVSDIGVTWPPSGFCHNNSNSSSPIACSATGFLLLFLCDQFLVIRYDIKERCLVVKQISTRTTTGGPSNEHIFNIRQRSPVRRESRRLSWRRHVAV